MTAHCVAASIQFRAVVELGWTFHIFCKEKNFTIAWRNRQEVSEPHQYRVKSGPQRLSQAPHFQLRVPALPLLRMFSAASHQASLE